MFEFGRVDGVGGYVERFRLEARRQVKVEF